ncbi:hypothetical protein CC2G_009265 [Coprinopsis cinerea AmutBmut pab1-1]|nr:hypothetical protein CC2G_009265 [Coprinopsis cinerea AmutBmut pab1-1]
MRSFKASLVLVLSALHNSPVIDALPSPGGQNVQDVYAPPVLRPMNGEVLTAGQVFRVVWDVTSPPHQITNPFGVIKLRKGNYTMSGVLSQLASAFSRDQRRS